MERYFRNHAKNKRSGRDSTCKRVFGISIDEYEARREAWKNAGDLCGLCKQPLQDKVNLDHDHETGKIRDFLHPACNMALGLLSDDPVKCRLAAEYLERHK